MLLQWTTFVKRLQKSYALMNIVLPLHLVLKPTLLLQKNDNPVVAKIENTDIVQVTTPTASNEIEAEVHAIEQDWHALGQGPLPEEYQVHIDQIWAREATKLMKVEGNKKEVVREKAGTEVIGDKERERRRKRNEKKRKRKMEKESVKEEKVEEVRTVPDDLSDNMLPRTPTKHVNAPNVLDATSDITPSPSHIPTASNCTTMPSTLPSQGTKPHPASPNDHVTSTKTAPTSP
jgi:hypothetical protein